MARFCTQITSAFNQQQVNDTCAAFLRREGFQPCFYKGETGVFKKGSGVVAAPQYLKIIFQGSQVSLEAWIRMALLPGVYVGEMGLTGFMGFAIKKSLKNKVNELIRYLTVPVPAPAAVR